MTSALTLDSRDLLRSEAGWQNDLEHFDVFAVAKLSVANVGGLMHTGARFESHLALAFVFEFEFEFEFVPSSNDSFGSPA